MKQVLAASTSQSIVGAEKVLAEMGFVEKFVFIAAKIEGIKGGTALGPGHAVFHKGSHIGGSDGFAVKAQVGKL